MEVRYIQCYVSVDNKFKTQFLLYTFQNPFCHSEIYWTMGDIFVVLRLSLFHSQLRCRSFCLRQ